MMVVENTWSDALNLVQDVDLEDNMKIWDVSNWELEVVVDDDHGVPLDLVVEDM